MEKATLLVSINKKGKTICQLEFENGKKMTLGQQFSITTDMNKKEVEVRREKGLIVEVRLNGKDLSSKAQNTQHVMSRHRTNSVQTSRPFGRTNSSLNNRTVNRMNKTQPAGLARAPYNFVQLNHTVVPAEFSDIDGLKQFLGGQKEKYSGHLQLKLETKTPLYIRDTIDYEQYVKQKNEDQKENPDFFSPGNQIKIPGSSIRGMVRNLVEIMSWSKFGFMDGEKRLFFRAVGERSNLGRHYRSLLVNENDYLFPKIQSGVLIKEKGKYFIKPSKKICGTQIYRVNFERNRRITGTSLRLDCFENVRVYFNPVAPIAHTHYIMHNPSRPYKLKYAKVEQVYDINQAGMVDGILVSTGNFANKKHMHWLINMPDTKVSPKMITEDVIKNYSNDVNRDERADLLKMLDKHPSGVPCFFITNNEDEVSALGHTGMFRIPYKRRIGDCLPKSLKGICLDLTDTLFGKESQFASRIFFEDAKLAPGQGDVLMGELSPKILSGPKPTTFQHYLKQPNGVNTPIDSLLHWDSNDAEIRGNKLYWHRNINRNTKFWREEGPIAAGDTQHTVINPVRPGVVFDGKLRFENLSQVELGALLCALDLPENCFHKLGMGKPLGLGSVHIQVRLFIKDLKKRYERLFDADKWQTGICEEKNLAIFKTAFERHVLKHIKESDVNVLWEMARLKQLKKMLDWGNTEVTNWLGKTDYMRIIPDKKINEFTDQRVLPNPEEVQ